MIGALAAARNLGDGGSSDVWAPEVVTPLDGIRELAGDASVIHHDGADPEGAAAVAAAAEVAVVVVGYTKADEGEYIGGSATAHLTDLMPAADEPEVAAAFAALLAADTAPFQKPGAVEGEDVGFSKGGDRTSLRLRPDDVALIRAVAAANPRTVVAIVAGSAVLIDEWHEAVPAVVQSWYAGMEGGRALADVLGGRAEPSGRLPFSVPVDEGHLPPFDPEATAVTYDAWHGYWRLARDGHPAAYPFGFGLSYTDLAVTDASVEVVGDRLEVTARVANRGERPGSRSCRSTPARWVRPAGSSGSPAWRWRRAPRPTWR